MMRKTGPFLLLALAALLGGHVLGATPEQFGVWGSAGPQFPPVPEGWTEVRDPATPLVSLEPEAGEARRGFVLFARDPMALVSPYEAPFPSERVTELKPTAARGEYEPIAFCIHALAPLAGVAIQAGALRSAQGDVIPPDHVDVRVVRAVRVPVDAKARTYRLAPFLLERRDAFAVPKGATAQVWLTLRVPDGAKGGDYSGTVSVRVADREEARLKLSVRVLPFELPPAPIETAMFYPRPPDDDGLLLKQLIDQREHGCTAFETPIGVQIKTRDQNFGDDDVAATRAHCQRMMDAAKKVFGAWRSPLTFEVGHQIAYYWDKEKNWFAFWPHSKKIESDLFKAIDVVRDLAKAGGWPQLRAYALDEAGAHNLLDEAVYYYRLIKQRYPEILTWTDIGGGMAMGHDEIGQLSPFIDFLSTNRFTPDIAKALVARGKPHGIYNGCGPTPSGARFFFGFWGWKTGAEQVAQWTYHFGNALFQGNGFRQEDEGYVYLAPDGPLPSVMWEAVREGIDDYRYVHLLRQLVDAARGLDTPAARRAAKEAEAALTDIVGRIGWGFQALASGDRTPPPHPSTLRKWRAQLVSQVLKLRALWGDKPIPATSPRPVSPLAVPWRELVEEKTQYGRELLPPSGFEDAMKPWRVEAWNGKGQGRLDAAEHHAGAQSVRIDVPAASGNQAVTVLVWPSWGDQKISVPLAGGRIYELSGWMKWADRSAPPTLRIAVPTGAAKATQNGKDAPDPQGWQRLWTRTEMSFPSVPKYLAVWVQGPGTVWVDDLSLREVIPPPLELALDQEAYDGLDRAGIATVSVSKLAMPARVQFSLARAGGEAVASLTAPFRGQAAVAGAEGQGRGVMLLAPVALNRCRFVFDPSGLTPGAYEARAALLDADGEAAAARTLTFERSAD